MYNTNQVWPSWKYLNTHINMGASKGHRGRQQAWTGMAGCWRKSRQGGPPRTGEAGQGRVRVVKVWGDSLGEWRGGLGSVTEVQPPGGPGGT